MEELFDTATIPAHDATWFAERLTEKFKNESQFALKVFSVRPGRRFDKVIHTQPNGQGGSVHCFVEKVTGHVFKPEGYNKPAKGVRYSSVEAALDAADVHGGYLYR